MLFWASSETYRPATLAVHLCSRTLEPVLNELLRQSDLADFDCQLRYIPIVMPPDLAKHYPARSKAMKVQRICDCAPQLNYDIFVSGNFEQQLTEYVAGIRTSGPILARLGGSAAQVEEFDRILSSATQHILTNQLEKTRH